MTNRKPWTFLIISLAVHLLAALLILIWRPVPRSKPRVKREMELEVELVRQGPPRKIRVEVEDADPVLQPRAVRDRRTKKPAAPPPAPDPAPMSLAMRRSRDLDLDLDPRRFLVGTRPRHRASERQEQGIKERLDRLLAADQAARDVRTGNVDPRLYDIQRDSETFFSPTWALTRGDKMGLGTVGSTVKELLRVMGRKYLESLERHADAQRVPSEAKTEATFTEVYNDVLHTEEGSREISLACSICINVGFGMEPQIAITRRSGKRAFDRMARAALLQAVKRRSPPEGSRPVRACYRFVAKFFRVPPMPFIGGTFDESKPSIEVFYPLKKILRTRVKLQTARYLKSHRPG